MSCVPVSNQALRTILPVDGVADSVSLAEDPEPTPEGVIFSDDFSSGDLNKEFNGSTFWEASTNLAVISGFSRSGDAGNCVRYNFGIAAEAVSELRFNLGDEYPEVYFQYYLYYPDGEEAIDRGPRAALSGSNNKFIRCWADTAEGEGNGADPRFGASYYADTPAGDSRIGMQAGVYPVEAPGSTSLVPIDAEVYADLLTDANRGRWVKIKHRFKASSSFPAAADGINQMWIDDVLAASATGLNARHATDVYLGMRKGYLQGAQDAQWDNTGTYIYMSDFAFSATGDFE